MIASLGYVIENRLSLARRRYGSVCRKFTNCPLHETPSGQISSLFLAEELCRMMSADVHRPRTPNTFVT